MASLDAAPVMTEKRATAVSASPEPIDTSATGQDDVAIVRTTSPVAASSPSSIVRVPNSKRPPPFSKKLTKSLFVRVWSRDWQPGWNAHNRFDLRTKLAMPQITSRASATSSRTAGSMFCSYATPSRAFSVSRASPLLPLTQATHSWALHYTHQNAAVHHLALLSSSAVLTLS